MAGHSKWANIKHTKGAADAKRGKQFTKVAKEITVSARLGGGDVESNPRLRRAIQEAKSISMPKDTIQRAIKRGTGELEGASYEEVIFEGYGPGGVAVMVECLTDNRTRTVAEVRFAFNKGNGSMGEMGCVGWMFDSKGELYFERTPELDISALQEAAIEAGADDIEEEENSITIYTAFEDYDKVKESLEQAGFETKRAGLTKVPQNTVAVSGNDASDVLKLIEKLEDNDDVQKVYANFDISDDELDKLLGSA